MSSGKICVVFFDVHDTLMYFTPSPPEMFAKILQEAGVSVPVSLIERVYPALEQLEAERASHKGSEKMFWLAFNAQLLQQLGIPDPDGTVTQRLVREFESVRWWKAFPDVKPTLQTLKVQGYRLGVIANATDLVEGRLAHLKLTEHFETITYSQEAGFEKPDPRIFRLALKRMNCTAEESLHIGDRYVQDVQGAQAAGLRAILLDRNNTHPDADCQRITSLTELPSHLLSVNGFSY